MPYNDVGDVHLDGYGGKKRVRASGPGREMPDDEFDADELEAGIRREMAEHGVDRDTAKRLVKDHLADGETYAKAGHSREYLEAFHAHARKQLSGWQSDLIHQAAMPASGGAANRRRPQHSPIELAALRKLAPDHVRDMSDDDLTSAWEQLGGWYKLAARKSLDTADYERAASFCAQEMGRRGLRWDEDSELGRAAVAKSRLGDRLSLLPAEIPLAKAAALVGGAGGLELLYHPILGDDGPVSDALVRVGVPLAKAAHIDPEADYQTTLYDLVLRRVGQAEAPEPLFLSCSPQGREPLAKAALDSPEKRLIWYVAAEPGMPDSYGHIITADEVEDECHRFALGPRKVFLEHGERVRLNADGKFPPEVTGRAHVVESGLAPMDLASFFGVTPPRPIPRGSWIVCIYLPEASLWQRLRDTPHGVSWRGTAVKENR